MLAKALARIILDRYHDDDSFYHNVGQDRSNFYRALVRESQLFDNDKFVGTEEYRQLINAIKEMRRTEKCVR